MSDAITLRVSSEIEDAYAEIGRTVVETAITQAWDTERRSGEEAEATITIRLMFESGPAEQMPVTCCVCTQDAAYTWICAGPCCPTSNPT